MSLEVSHSARGLKAVADVDARLSVDLDAMAALPAQSTSHPGLAQLDLFAGTRQALPQTSAASGPVADHSPLADLHSLGHVGGVTLNAGLPAIATGQLWFGVVGGGGELGVGHFNNDGSTFVEYAPASQYSGYTATSVVMDTAAGYYFTVNATGANLGTISAHKISDGSLVETLQVADASAGEISNAIAIDPVSHVLYVGKWGSTTGAGGNSGIVSITYNPANGDLNNNGAYNGGQQYVVHTPNNGTHSPTDVRSMFYDQGTHKLYYVDNDNNYTDGQFTQPTNGVYVVDTTNPAAGATLLTLDSQFHFATGADAYARISSVAVNDAAGVIYFTTYQTSADGANHGLDGLWEMAIGGGTAATQILGNSAALHYAGPQGGLVYDAQNNQLFLSDQQVTSPTNDRHIVQLQMSANGQAVASVLGTYGIDQLVGHSADPNAYTTGLSFNALPILGLTGTNSHVGEQNVTPVDLTSALSASDADGGYLAGATVKVSGGTFSNTLNDSASSDDHLGYINAGSLQTSGTVSGITLAYNSSTETLTLTGYATLATYQSVLNNIGFSSTGDNPTNYGSNTTRTITWSLNDGTPNAPTNGQNTGSQTITIDAVNDAAVITGANPAALTETNAGLSATGTLTITDPDTQTNNMTVASVTASGTTAGLVPNNATLLGYLTLGSATTTHVANATASTDGFTFNSASEAFNYLAPGQTLTLTYVVNATDSADGTSTGSHNVVVTINGTNDAPSGADATLTALEDTARVFTAADFGFTDVDGGSLGGVKFTTIPGAGQVLLNGVAVTAGQTVAASEINAGHLTYLSALNGNGNGYTSLTFQVQDNQGTANGGVDLDPSANTLTFNVTAVNDAPDLTPNTPAATTFTENGSAVQLLSGAAVSDPDGEGNYNGGSFEAKITAGAASGDSITLLASSNFHLVGGTSLFDNFANYYGQVSGNGTTDVKATFSSNVTGNVAGQIARAFGFSNSTDNPGSGDRTLTYTLNDGGNLGTGGALTDTVTQTVHVSAVNDAPAINSLADQTVNEDQAGVLSGFFFSDVDGNGAVETATFNVASGSLSAASGGGVTVSGSGASLSLSGTLSNINAFISGNHLTFQGAANATSDVGLDVFLNDGGATGSGGSQQASQSVTIHVNAVNDAPTGADTFATILEDTSYTFATGDFGFSDPNDSPANTLLAVEISTLPANGSLTLNGVAVTAGQFVQASDISAGKLVFTPAANANGAGYGSFTFQVQDNGGTASGGVDLDQSPNTFTLNVTAVNDAPSGASNTVTTLEDNSHVFTTGEFGFSDAVDGDSLLAVKIGAINGAGSLTLNGVAVTAGQSVSASEISLGHLVFTPAANANGAAYGSFTFQVQDNGGTANGGVDTDPTTRTMTVDVTSVNDAPSAADKHITTLEDTGYTFSASDFGFSDSDGNSLQAVKIDVLPTGGSLTLNGSAVTAGQLVAATDIGGLVFTPAANINGPAESTITFQVQDDGGVANGGVDLSTAKVITFDVTPVNDAPSGADKTITTLEDTGYTFSASDFGFSDVDGNGLQGVTITSLPASGALTLNGAAVSANDFIATGDISMLVFTPATNANGAGNAAFTFTLKDDGGTANGGVDTSAAKTITFDVTSVNDAPSGADKTISTLEDTAHTFAASDFGFSDVDGNSLLGVTITSLPASGALTLNGNAVSANDFIATADIGNLVFTPAADSNGAGYAAFTFTVTDDGGTSNGGADTSNAKTITFDVTSVNDAPSGADKTITTLEDTAYTFTASDFGFSDSDGNSLQAVKIDTLPSGGALTLNGSAVTAGQLVAAADIGGLVFTPTADANGPGEGSFTFQVQDDGGVANGGVDLSAAKTITFDVTSVNDAPTAADKTIATNEDQAYTFSASDFGFSDSDGNSLQAVKITTVPGPGTLTLNGSAVAAGDFVQAADLGNLIWYPPGDGNGSGLASFTFQVQDDGGTANGGADLSTTKTITFNVAAVNDDPVVNAGIAAHNVYFDDAFAFFIGASAFADVDGDTLTYSAVVNLGGGSTQALPGWLTFDGATGKFTGTPPKSDIGVLDIQVTASDGHGGSVATDFNLTIVGNQTINGTVSDETLRGHNGDDVINGNGGHDTLIGSDGNDTLTGGTSADALKGGAGDDVLRGGGGGDNLNGGSGNDVALYYDSATGVHINLLDQSQNSGGAAGDMLTFIERIGGSSHDDVLIGGNTRNWFKGANGNDSLVGSGSSDTLRGGDGADTLHGGGGHDLLIGGAGADTFDFSSVADSGKMNSDLITDFSTAEGDQLDLSLLDGDAGAQLTFIGTARFDGLHNEVRYVVKNGETYVSADLDHDKHADFQVRLAGTVTLHAGDFVL